MYTKYPIDYWRKRIQSMPLDEEMKSSLIKYIKEKQPYGVSYLEIYDWVKTNIGLQKWLGVTPGLFEWFE